jgi:two-component system nitrogen regulation sensor histidine kinase NtrY
LKRSLSYLIVGIILIAIGWFVNFNRVFYPTLQEVSKKISRKIELKKQACIDEISQLEESFNSDGLTKTRINTTDYYSELFNEKGIILAVYENNELVFWSDNRVAFDYLHGPGIPDEQYLQLDNGWYGLQKIIKEEREFYAFFLIKSTYPYHNQFLHDAFQKDFGVSDKVGISLIANENSIAVVDAENVIFNIYRISNDTSLSQWLNFALLIIGAFLLILGADLYLTKGAKPWYLLLAWLCLLVLMRWISLNYCKSISDLRIFDPTVYASSSFFPSLGDFLINSGLLVYLSSFFKRAIAPRIKISTTIFSALFFTLPVLYFGLIITPLIIGLIVNSSILFNLANLFEVNEFSFVGVAAIGLLFYSFYILSASASKIIRLETLSSLFKLAAFVLILAIHITIAHLMGIVNFYLILWPTVAFGFVLFLNTHPKFSQGYKRGSLLLLLFTAFAWYFILHYETLREERVRKIYAEKLASDEDPVTELLFLSFENAVQNDSLIRNTILMPDKFSNEVLSEQIANKFIDRYWNKFTITSHVYKGDSTYWGALPDVRPPLFSDFHDLIKKHGFESTTSPNLFHLYNYPENLSYLASIPIYQNDNELIAIICVGFQARIFPDEIGYPELLIEATTNNAKNLSDYSFARYVDKKLISSKGDYNYRTGSDLYEDNLERFELEDYNGFSHLIHRADDRTIIVVSLPRSGFFDRITGYNYLLAFYGLALLILLLINSPNLFQFSILNNLNIKIQLLSSSIVLLTLLTFGLATRFYAKRQFTEKNYSVLSEKTQSVLIELEGPYKGQTELSPAMIDQISAQLKRLSYVFFSDINVYNSAGELIATSQPKIFDSGLIAPRMNSRAYIKMNINHKSEYVHEEKIGSLTHLSSYIPLRNETNDLLAFVNLPYFARQGALERELSTLIVTIVNIFVLLFALSIIVAILISDWITRPIRLLQQSLSNIELGKQNEPIPYLGSDVIGDLVKEYNRKVSELAYNAEQLARSERESAWREMAKQVAHEIKNPLTPMKLNLQLLQKAVADGADDIDVRFKKTSKSLIEQIDALTQIANEFSNFANMPRAEFAEVDLVSLINSVVDLYGDLPNQQVLFHSNTQEKVIARADYKQLSRALQNLIKNGLQAAPEGVEPKVLIELTSSQKGHLITVEDNGTGIPENMKSRIFQPNFTTKSTGTGLGLAMVKSIIQNMNSKIWFEDATPQGTIFYIEIPAVIAER